MSTLGGPFKERLMTALHTAVGHFNESGDPNASVVKAAEDHNFNVDQTERLVETFNTARTIYHYKNASDRSVEFSLADPNSVIPAIYDEKTVEKDNKEAGFDYSMYEMPEAHYEEALDVKYAGIQNLDISEPTEFLDTNLDRQAEKALGIVKIQRDLADTSRHEANTAAAYAARVITKVANSISMGYEESCVDRYSRLMSLQGTNGELSPVLSKLAEFVPTWLKEAQVDLSAESIVEDSDISQYDAQLKEARDYMQSEATMLALAGELDKEANDFEVQFMTLLEPVMHKKKAEGPLDTFFNPALCKSGATESLTVRKREDKGLFTGDDLTRTTTSKPGPIIPSAIAGAGPAVAKTLSDSYTAGHESQNRKLSDRLKNTQRQIMLEDLMSSDPVLSEESPENVTRAYQAVLQLAPEVANNKEVVRAILRQSVHSLAIGPYDAETWTGLEKNLRNISSAYRDQGAGDMKVTNKGQ